MGRIYYSRIKRVGERILLLYSDKLTTDFYQNKKLVMSVTDTSSKFLINKIAGYVTSKMKKMQRAKLQEAEKGEEKQE